MSTSKILTNHAHGSGLTCLSFSRDGALAYTGGSDSLVRVWRMDEGQEQEPSAAIEANEGVTTVAAAKNCWLSGSGDSEVRRYTTGTTALEGLVTSVVGVPVRCVAIDPQGQRVAVTSDELAIKVVDLEETTKVFKLSGHTRGVRRVTWHPSGSLLTTSGADGKIIVWNLSQEEAVTEKLIEGVIPEVHDSEASEYMHDCSAVWHPSGQSFFVASRLHDIVNISRTTWAKTYSFTDAFVSGAPTALAISPNGLYLASSCAGNGNTGVAEVFIWSVQNRRVLWRHPGTPSAFVTQLAFSPTKNLVAWTDTEGVFMRLLDAVPSGAPDPVRPPNVTVATTVPLKRKSTPLLWGDDDTPAVGEDVGMDEADMGDDWIIDDLGGGMEDEPADGRVKAIGDGFVKEMVSITKAQSAFQPGSTPMENKKRYLAYNMIGVIEVTDQDTHHIVNVEFHDRSTRKSYHFTDHFKYDIAYLGERGALFACPPESEHPAQVVYKPYGTWSSQSEWTYVLPQGQSVLGLAAGGERPISSLRTMSASGGDIQGQGNVVIATSTGDLTFISGGGMERIVLGLEGDLVAMAAAEEYVIVVHRPGATTIDGSQSLVATMISFEDFEVLQEKSLPIPKGYILKWIGMTDEGAPAIYDSSGYVHIMINFRRPNRAAWARLLDTNAFERKQGKDESYWLVGLSQNTVMCLILKGRQEHPGFPRPLIQEVPVRLPFRNIESKEAPIEEQVARERIHINLARDALGDELSTPELDKREVELDKSLIKLIQAACKADKAPRVLELTKRLHFTHSIDAASQLAGFYRLVGLQEKIEAIKRWRLESPNHAEEARDRRKGLSREDEPLSRPKPFQDFKPPPRIERPGLARSTGVVEHTEFTAASAAARAARSRVAEMPPPISRSASPEGKRKRGDEEDLASNAYDGEANPKRRAVGEPDVFAAKSRANPFARKSGQEPNRNPFARKPDGNKVIQKSDSFFSRVEAVESDKGKRPLNGKGKEKEKTLAKQMTLFGLPPVAANEKKSRNKKKGGEDSESQETSVSNNATISDSQATDDVGVNAADFSEDATLVETQNTDPKLPSTQTAFDPPEDDDEPIEWPDSPQAEVDDV